MNISTFLSLKDQGNPDVIMINNQKKKKNQASSTILLYIPHYVFPVISTQIIDGYNPVLSNYSRDVGLSPLLILKHQEKKTK